MSHSDRASGQPIRFRIAYSGPAALIREFTRGVGRGDSLLESARSVPTGTRFLFELVAAGISRPIEVEGEVCAVTSTPRGRFLVRVGYRPGARGDLDRAVQTLLTSHQPELGRAHARVPVNLLATQSAANSPAYLIRDLSLGGMGLEIQAPRLPETVRRGTALSCGIPLSSGLLQLQGAVAWTFAPPRGLGANPAFGVNFNSGFDLDDLERLDRLLSLQEFPRAKARLELAV